MHAGDTNGAMGCCRTSGREVLVPRTREWAKLFFRFEKRRRAAHVARVARDMPVVAPVRVNEKRGWVSGN